MKLRPKIDLHVISAVRVGDVVLISVLVFGIGEADGKRYQTDVGVISPVMACHAAPIEIDIICSSGLTKNGVQMMSK